MTKPTHDKSLHAAALEWHNAGFCVVPSHEDSSKRPFGKWKEYQHERPTVDTLENWIATDRYTGIGLIMGAASGGAEMIELEGPLDQAMSALSHIKTTAQSLGCLELLNRVLLGCIESSGGNGIHAFYRVSDGPALGNTKLATDETGKVLAETRGEGGFVIVAPTTGRTGHDDGAVYALLAGTTPANTPVITSAERDLLHQLFTMALHRGSTETPPPVTATPVAVSEGLTPWDDFARTTNWGDLLIPAGWTPVFVAPDQRTHWTRPGKDPNDGTSATTLNDGPMYVFSTSTTFPSLQGMSKQYVYAHLHHGGDLREAARALNLAGYGDPAPILTAWEPIIDTATVETQRIQWVREKFPIIDWHELWADETEEEWIVEPLLPARRLIALYSAPKVGKSLLMLEIAAAVATGTAMFGYPAARIRRVLYVDFENDPRGDVRTRLQNMHYSPDQLDNLCYLTFPTMAALDSEPGSLELLSAVSAYACEVVVIDTVSRAVQGDENENDTWLNFYRHTGLKLKQAGIALVRLDHSGKDASKGQRGGSAKSGDVDAIWRLSVATDTRIDLECDASRFPITNNHLVLRRETDPLRHVSTNDTYRDKVAQLYEQMEEAQVPKIVDMTVKAMRLRMKEAGLRFDTSLVSKSFIHEYATRIVTFEQTHLVDE